MDGPTIAHVIDSGDDPDDPMPSREVEVLERGDDGWRVTARLRSDHYPEVVGFGYGVAVSGDVIVVSQLHVQRGLYVFRRGADGWAREAFLPSVHGPFGSPRSVAVHGDTAVLVGEVFERIDGRWVWQTELPTGSEVALHGDVIVRASVDASLVQVFRRSEDGWELEADLVPSRRTPLDRYGASLDVWGNTIVVGAPQDRPLTASNGAAYIFAWDGTSWREEARLVPDPPEHLAELGKDLAIWGDTVLVGTTQAEGAYFFERRDGVWTATRRAGHQAWCVELTAGYAVTWCPFFGDGHPRGYRALGDAGDACTTEADCVAGPCEDGRCTGAPAGTACARARQCASSTCVDGVCCDTACDGLCERCDVAGSSGACAAIPADQDPDDECATACDGNGACAPPDAGAADAGVAAPVDAGGTDAGPRDAGDLEAGPDGGRGGGGGCAVHRGGARRDAGAWWAALVLAALRRRSRHRRRAGPAQPST